MDKCDSLLEQAQGAPGSLSFKELCTLAECFGFVEKRQRGSHVIYVNPKLGTDGFMNFQSDSGKAKGYQVRQLLKAIEVLLGQS